MIEIKPVNDINLCEECGINLDYDKVYVEQEDSAMHAIIQYKVCICKRYCTWSYTVRF